MKKTQRFIALIMTVVCVFTLFSCKGKDENDAENIVAAATDNEQPKTDKKPANKTETEAEDKEETSEKIF